MRGVKMAMPEAANDDTAFLYSTPPPTRGNLALKAAPEEAAYECPIRFQGQWQDEETGLYYNRHRHYDPLTAQYMSPDPIGLAGGDRPQGFVTKPTVWNDPLGLSRYRYTPKLADNEAAALGKNVINDEPALQNFSSQQNAKHWEQWGDKQNWDKGVNEIIEIRNNKIKINLDGISSVKNELELGLKNKSAFGQELWMLKEAGEANPSFWNRLEFFRDGKSVPNPLSGGAK